MRPRLRPLALLLLGPALAPTGLVGQSAAVPFARDLQLAWASSLPNEPDYETVLTVLQVDSGEARIRVSWNRGTERKWRSAERPVSDRERRLARSIYFYSSENDARQFRGTNQSMASGAILRELKQAGRSSIILLEPSVSSVPFRGVLQRVGAGTEPFRVLLDGQLVTLTGLRARGTLTGERTTEFELLILDDPETPWVLEAVAREAGQAKGGRRLLVRIATTAREDAVGTALVKTCSATVHDLFFATGSDALDSTSTPALAAVARILVKHPDWRITIVGHTDSLGTAAANLDLSRRRAERVRGTLVEQHRIAADRLRSEGKGETVPIDDNATLAGRARNRRVDLVRACR